MSTRYAATNGTDRLEVFDRYAKPLKGDATLIVCVKHRTLGHGRSILLSEAEVRELRDALTDWLVWSADFHSPQVPS